MGKQTPPKSKRGRPPGSTNKSLAKKSSGNIDKFVTSKMEKSFSSVQIKKEKIDEATQIAIANISYFKCKYIEHTSRGSTHTDEATQRKAKVIESPDKVKIRRSKTDKHSLSPPPRHKKPAQMDIEREKKKIIDLVNDDRKVTDMEIDEESQLIQVNEENVFTFVKSTKLGQLLALPIDQMRQVVQAWKIRQQDTNSDAVKTMSSDVLMLDIEEAKEEVETEMRREFLRERIESEVREDLAQIKFMNLSKSSSLAEI